MSCDHFPALLPGSELVPQGTIVLCADGLLADKILRGTGVSVSSQPLMATAQMQRPLLFCMQTTHL